MKILINSFEDLSDDQYAEILGMSRIGFIPAGSSKTIEVYVHTDDRGEIPHFHVRKYGKSNSFEWETCVKFESAEYFLHGKYSDKLPNRKVARELDSMLRMKMPNSRFSETYWERAIDEWNNNNSAHNLPYDLEQPNYSQLR